MIEERLGRIEDMLSQLISMVAETNKKYDSVDSRIEYLMESQNLMRDEMNGFREDQSAMRDEMNGFREDQSAMRDEMNAFREDQSAMRDEMNAFRKDQSAMRDEMNAFRKDQSAMRDENNDHHNEVMNRFSELEADQDHIWKKAVTNEREFAKFKIQYGI